MLDELLQYLNKEGVQYLISWIKERLNLKFDKKHMVSLTAAEFQALIDSDSVDPDTYYSIIDDSQSETRYAHYVLFPVADWVEEDGMWSQTVRIAGMTDDQTLFLIPYKQDLVTEAESKAYDKDYGLFVSGKGQTLNGAVRYKLWTKPSADITIGLMITDILSTGGGGGKGGSGVVVSDTEPEDPTVELWVDTSPKGNVDLVTRDEIADLLENGVCCDDLAEGDPILAPVEVLMKTDVLTLEEIQASSPEMLEWKVASAGAVGEVNNGLTKMIPFLTDKKLMPYGETSQTVDCNNLGTTVMSTHKESTNTPVSGQYFIIVSYQLGGNLFIQYAMSFNDNKAYMRIKWSNWREWVQISN